MAAPNPKPKQIRRAKSEDEIRAETQRMLRDPAMAALIKQACASRARGESVRLEDFVKDAGTVKGRIIPA